MDNLLAHFEGSELVDFINFVNLLVHKLQVRFFLYSIPRLLHSCIMTARSVRRIGRPYWPFECPHYESHVPARYRNGRYTHA
jgi:hypothetical protein